MLKEWEENAQGMGGKGSMNERKLIKECEENAQVLWGKWSRDGKKTLKEWGENDQGMGGKWSRNGRQIIKERKENALGMGVKWTRNRGKWSRNGRKMLKEWEENAPGMRGKLEKEWAVSKHRKGWELPRNGLRITDFWTESDLRSLKIVVIKIYIYCTKSNLDLLHIQKKIFPRKIISTNTQKLFKIFF